ncbi:MAG: hypothetical protein CL685_01950 [Candidatus Magasanikbacteria bacterium]|nr:hypothetical protein [Candidatus Magasanikbacteria bacterium]|tara:strand:- start:839 stop:2290 length:1452 start_codon:yes stop_codon:yes gene_type:complete
MCVLVFLPFLVQVTIISLVLFVILVVYKGITKTYHPKAYEVEAARFGIHTFVLLASLFSSVQVLDHYILNPPPEQEVVAVSTSADDTTKAPTIPLAYTATTPKPERRVVASAKPQRKRQARKQVVNKESVQSVRVKCYTLPVSVRSEIYLYLMAKSTLKMWLRKAPRYLSGLSGEKRFAFEILIEKRKAEMRQIEEGSSVRVFKSINIVESVFHIHLTDNTHTSCFGIELSTGSPKSTYATAQYHLSNNNLHHLFNGEIEEEIQRSKDAIAARLAQQEEERKRIAAAAARERELDRRYPNRHQMTALLAQINQKGSASVGDLLRSLQLAGLGKDRNLVNLYRSYQFIALHVLTRAVIKRTYHVAKVRLGLVANRIKRERTVISKILLESFTQKAEKKRRIKQFLKILSNAQIAAPHPGDAGTRTALYTFIWRQTTEASRQHFVHTAKAHEAKIGYLGVFLTEAGYREKSALKSQQVYNQILGR